MNSIIEAIRVGLSDHLTTLIIHVNDNSMYFDKSFKDTSLPSKVTEFTLNAESNPESVMADITKYVTGS